MTTALGLVPANEHRELGHPENPERLQAVLEMLTLHRPGVGLYALEPVTADVDQLAMVHDQKLISLIKNNCARGDGHLDADTYITAASFEQATLAVGTACKLVDTVMEQEADNAFAIVRPPGHHAERRKVGGFCLFNNIAVAARHVQTKHNLDRVMIIDFDVHHGNGTQDIFYDDPNVLFVSLHLHYPFFYPGSGGAEETGVGAGSGSTLNVPLPPGAGDAAYEQAFRQVVIPLARRFGPEFILVSAGFDAHWIDPLAAAGLSLSGYSLIARQISLLANDLCGGRCVYILEGGYHREALAFGVLNVLNVLGGLDKVVDPLGLSPYNEPDINLLIQHLLTLHLLS
ncbi:MAG TPA: histone deacetylase [Patescibacteria group bacterium]|nr:histone deacetylase [Patescibacteria group bacterium]